MTPLEKSADSYSKRLATFSAFIETGAIGFSVQFIYSLGVAAMRANVFGYAHDLFLSKSSKGSGRYLGQGSS